MENHRPYYCFHSQKQTSSRPGLGVFDQACLSVLLSTCYPGMSQCLEMRRPSEMGSLLVAIPPLGRTSQSSWAGTVAQKEHSEAWEGS